MARLSDSMRACKKLASTSCSLDQLNPPELLIFHLPM
jgi:hypothetical protein